MGTKKIPPENFKKDTLPLSWVLIGIGFLLTIVVMIILVVNRMNDVPRNPAPKTKSL